MAQNYGLGRGLSSLIPQKQNKNSQQEKIDRPKEDYNYFGSSAALERSEKTKEMASGGMPLEVEVAKVFPNPHQPRKTFDELKLKELAASIKEHGIIQPLTVTKTQDGYELIAGERRFQAAKIAGLLKVPVIIRDASELQKLELAIVENIQRHDLDPIEEARSYKKLIEEFEVSQEEVALKVGKSRSSIANKLRLLTLPIEIQKALMEGRISEGHAKAILAVDNPEKQRALFELIMKNSLTVRQVESKVKEVTVRTHKRSVVVDPEAKSIEDEISQKLGTKVKLTKAGGGGKIIIEYYSQEELGNILKIINK